MTYLYNPVFPELPQEFFSIFLNLDLLAIFLAKKSCVNSGNDVKKLVKIEHFGKNQYFHSIFLFIITIITPNIIHIYRIRSSSYAK